jgi:hypothetical protein
MKSVSKYFRTYTESHEGEEGFFYAHVEGGMITRMINVFGDRLLWASPTACKDELYDFTDQPEWSDTDSLRTEQGDIEISESEFEELWSRAVR